MEAVKKSRSVVRTLFTKSFKKFLDLAEPPVQDMEELQVRFRLLSDYTSQLEVFNHKYFDLLLESDAEESALCDEMEKVEEYKARFLSVEAKYNHLVKQTASSSDTTGTCVGNSARKLISKLPKIELFKFDGQLSNWLKFWGQFKKIDEDMELSKEDKLHYLSQSMVPGSRAYDLVNSFPPTSENYDKAIESLKARFGKTDLLIEFYIRELLNLVMTNLARTNEKFQVSTLYDKLESHLRALESLQITKESCAPLLYPLVESALPEELLRTWQRHTNGFSCEPKDRLGKLVEFLKGEVGNEVRISMAMRGFTSTNRSEAKGTSSRNGKTSRLPLEDEVATAAGLVAGKTSENCIFCEKSHESSTCQEAKNMSLENRTNKVKEKKACFKCLKNNHSYRFCRYNKKCTKRGKRHVLLMCKDYKDLTTKIDIKDVVTSASNISVHGDVFLQTLRVELRNEKGKTKLLEELSIPALNIPIS